MENLETFLQNNTMYIQNLNICNKEFGDKKYFYFIDKLFNKISDKRQKLLLINIFKIDLSLESRVCDVSSVYFDTFYRIR